jgi:rhodanese-related sulfurtransferase
LFNVPFPLIDQLLTFVQAHPFLFAALALVIGALIANEIHGSATGGKKLGALEAVRLINDRDPVVVDVRPHADFKKGHLLHAMNIPAAKIAERASEISKDKARPVLVYCALGNSQVDAAARLRQLGHTEVYQLRGGLNGWMSASLPVTTK